MKKILAIAFVTIALSSVCWGQARTQTLYVTQFPGDFGTAVQACYAALPASGGICDATGYTGTIGNTTNPFATLNATKSLELRLGHLLLKDTSCWFFNDDGNTPPAHAAVAITGAGYDAASITAGKTPVSGTVIDMSCNSGPAKLDTRGAGTLAISGIAFMDTSGGNLPFIQTTNTILLLHDNQFFGSKNGTACNQDAIVLGGTTTGINGNANAAFQGYGSYVKNNFFNHIRRAVYGRVFANGVVISYNTVWAQAGSNLAGGAAIEFDSGGNQTNVGNKIEGNLVEVSNYPYFVKFTNSGYYNSVAHNDLYDPTATFLAGVRFETNSQYNLVEDGYTPNTYAVISEGSGVVNTNSVISAHTGTLSAFQQGLAVANNVPYDTYNASGTLVQVAKEHVDNKLYLGNSEELVLTSTTLSYTGTNISVPTSGVYQFSTDAGLSRIAAGVVGVGNGTAADVSGTLRGGILWMQGSSTGGFTANYNNLGIGMGSGAVVGWTSGAAQNANDTAFSRTGAAAVAIGNGTALNGSGTITAAGYMVSNKIHSTGLTGSVATATLCPSAAGGCNVAGQYHIFVSLIQTGTACGTPGPGAALVTFTYTDSNGTTRTTSTTGGLTFQSSLSSASAATSADWNISTNGTVIQYAVAYTACTSGTGTYQVDISVDRKF